MFYQHFGHPGIDLEKGSTRDLEAVPGRFDFDFSDGSAILKGRLEVEGSTLQGWTATLLPGAELVLEANLDMTLAIGG